MKILSKKGFVLEAAIFFFIVATIMSLGFYNYGLYIFKEAGIQEPRSIRGYYAALAGARYAYILLKDPVANNLFTTPIHNGETRVLNIHSDPNCATFRNDIHLRNNETLTVTIEEWRTGETRWTTDNYRVTSEFHV